MARQFTAERRPRSESRAHFEAPVRISLLEQDADEGDSIHARIYQDMESRMEKIERMLWGAMGAGALATIGAVLNLVFGKV